MPIEIERKYLLANEAWRERITRSQRLRQGYLTDAGEKASVRVRVSDEQAWLNIKSATIGASRMEYEYSIPLSEALEMLSKLAGRQVDKTRHYVEHQGHTWEIDEFHDGNVGLLVAEIELSAENEAFALPDWAGEDVTHDVRYYNSCLAERPYSEW